MNIYIDEIKFAIYVYLVIYKYYAITTFLYLINQIQLHTIHLIKIIKILHIYIFLLT